MNEESDLSLLKRIQDGDEIAFRIFFSRYRKRIFVFVDQLIHSRSDTEEIVQDTFLKVWTFAGRISKMERPSDYIYMIARNKTLNHIRNNSKNKQYITQVWANQMEIDNSTLESIYSEDLQQVIQKALKNLPNNKLEIFRLSRYEGLNHFEIAAKLGLSQSRVKNILVEILKYLKVLLQRHADLITLLLACIFSQLL